MKATSFPIFLANNSRWFPLFISILAFLLYANTLSNEYNLDDELVTINHRNTARGLDAIKDIFSQYYYEDAMGYKYEYRPITHLSFALEHEFLGESPQVSHLINCLLYALLCLMLYKLLLSFFSQNLAILAFIATLFFEFHPLHTEVVASIKNRDELLAVLFGLCGSLFFKNSLESKKHYLLLVATVFFLLALYSKYSVLPLIFSSILVVVFITEMAFWKVLIAVFPVFISIAFFNFFDSVPSFRLFIFSYTVVIFSLLIKNIRHLLSALFKVVKEITGWLKNSLLSLNNYSEDKEDNYYKTTPSGLLLKSQRLYSVSLFLFLALFAILAYDLNVLAFLLLPVFIFILYFSYNPTLFYLSFLANTILIPFDIFLGYKEETFGFISFLFCILNLYPINWSKGKYSTLIVIYTWLVFLGILVLEFYYVKTTLPYLGLVLTLFSPLIFIPLLKNQTLKQIALFILTSSTLFFINNLLPEIFFFLSIVGVLWLFYYFFIKKNRQSIKIIFVLILWFSIVNSVRVLNVYIFQNKPEKSEKVLIDSSPEKINKPINFDRPLQFVETPVNLDAPINVRLATGMYVFGKYLQKTIVPYPMGFYYGYAYITPKTFNDILPWLFLGIFVSLGLISLYSILKEQYAIAFGLILYLAGIFQVLGIYMPIPGSMGDRFLFIPSLGFSLLVAYPCYLAFHSKWQKIATYLLIGILFYFGFLTMQRNTQWKNHLTLMRHDIAYLDKSAQAHNLLALNLMKYSFEKKYQNKAQSMREEALQHFKRAVEIYPDFMNAWYDLGRVYLMFNNLDQAYPCFNKVRSLDSTFVSSTVNMAMISFNQGKVNEAENLYKEAIRIDPGTMESYSGLGYVYFKGGKLDESINVNQEAIKRFPQWTEPYQNLITIYLSKKDTLSAQRVMNQMPK